MLTISPAMTPRFSSKQYRSRTAEIQNVLFVLLNLIDTCCWVTRVLLFTFLTTGNLVQMFLSVFVFTISDPKNQLMMQHILVAAELVNHHSKSTTLSKHVHSG